MSAIDSALERLRETGPEFTGGLSNHGPMAAEALVALLRRLFPARPRRPGAPGRRL